MTEVKLTKAAWKAALSVPIVEEWRDTQKPQQAKMCGRRLDKG